MLYGPFVQLSFTGHHTYGSPSHRRSDTKWEALGHTQPESNTEKGGRKKRGEGGTVKERRVDEGLATCWQRQPFIWGHLTAVTVPSHRQTTQQPCSAHKESGVHTNIFIPPQDTVVMLVKSKPRPGKHILFSLTRNYVNSCKGPSTVCAIQSYRWGLLIRKCKVGHL